MSTEVWLETAGGERKAIRAACYLGRSPANDVVLANDKASRRHAMVNLQGQGDYWLVDLGSSNGTYLNGRRIAQPAQLQDGDRVGIGGDTMIFRHPAKPGLEPAESAEVAKTIQDIKAVPCWLLVADIEGSTAFVQKLPPGEAPKVTANWLADCRQAIEGHRGMINKFLGDGFLAYWPSPEAEDATEEVAGAMGALRALQARDHPRFRIVVHFGKVYVGGVASLGEESLLGYEVNFVFRMEKLAASRCVACMLSESAHERLGSRVAAEEECREGLPGFSGKHLFFAATSMQKTA
jgi:adenylate cyclase